MTHSTSFLNQLKYYILLLLSISISSCTKQNKTETTNNTAIEQSSALHKESIDTGTGIFHANTADSIDKNIRSIFQDKSGNYWFGTNGAGVYRYNNNDNRDNIDSNDKGKTLLQFTVKDGLCNNQIQSIQEDKNGNIWFGTGAFGVSRFDGKTFTTFTNKENLQLSDGSDSDWKSEGDDLWFFVGGGAFRYNGNSFVYLPLSSSASDKPDSNSNSNSNPGQLHNSPYDLSRYAVYSILKDKKGNVWFGTQAQGVCRYDGKSFTWFTEKGLSGSAVLGLFEDSKGNLWFGNNGSGLFRYDPSAHFDSAQHKSLRAGGKSLVNFTEEKGLGNSEFKISGKSKPGTLARIYSISEDSEGNLWIGTVDAGVWRYDGNSLTNYTTKDGLTGNAVSVIYKDKTGELWFGTEKDGICKFIGKTFTQFVL